MRRCKVCGEKFEAPFSFCPIDGTQFGDGYPRAPHSEFTLTIVSDAGLIQRLAAELNFLVEQVIGFESGRGEGSRPVPARAKGGGGGGLQSQTPASQGRPPQPSVVPAPIPTVFARMPLALPAAGLDIDPALWRNLNYASYGDPRSKSTTASNGPGDGGGVGNGNGPGIGEGDGPGFGRGKNGNIGGGDRSPGGGGIGGARDNPNEVDRVYSSPEVTTRARVLSKPEPQYTEEARRNQITGMVILRVVFSRSGEVTNIRAIQTLSDGLTEKAIAAARKIRFVPATRNGQAVSMYMQLEYNFNLY